MKVEFPRQIFEKQSNDEFHATQPSESRVVARGQTDGRTDVQTDRHDKANSCFSNFAKAPKMETLIHEIVQNTQIYCAGKTRIF